ncbi:MAG: MBL fold metallo-hydrolase [Thermoplasmata archaeon]|nr:MBL fold metallo-hydrolase [Thermoplasmata archaeon]
MGSLSAYVENKGVRMLFDCGLTPSKPPKYPMKPPAVDLAFLSHAHIDHSGMIPWLCATYGMDVVATKPSVVIGTMLLEDSVKVSSLEGYPAPYDKGDVKLLKRHFQEVTFDDILDVGGMDVVVHSAGHIPGAAMYEVQSDRTMMFTGDINTLDSHLVNGAKPVKCDILVIESTYSGRDHPPRKETERHFLNKTKEVVERGGLAIVPAFAVGRTQEMMMTLMNSGLNVVMDGMGSAVSRHYLNMPQYLRSPERLADAVAQIKAVRNPGDRKTVAKNADVIITTSGMVDGGPVLNYIAEKKNDKKSAVLITGFQVEGTNGRMLMESGEMVIVGERSKIHCELGFYDFSAHADHNELIKFIKACEPEDVVLCHGDNRTALANDLKVDGFKIHMPKEGQQIEL